MPAIRQLTDDDQIITISELRVEVRTLGGVLMSSREPTLEEIAMAQAAPADLPPLVRDPGTITIAARRAL